MHGHMTTWSRCPDTLLHRGHGTSHVPSAEVTHERRCPAGESRVRGSSQVPATSRGAYGGPNGRHCPSDESHGRHPPVDEGENSTDGVLASVACMLCKKRRWRRS